MKVRVTKVPQAAVINNVLREIVGKSLADATDYIWANDLTFRTTKVNGKAQICTRDFRLDRVSVEVVDNTVTVARIG
jgi:hypothetical protein